MYRVGVERVIIRGVLIMRIRVRTMNLFQRRSVTVNHHRPILTKII